MIKNKNNLIFIKMLNFMGLKPTSMQNLFHSYNLHKKHLVK